MANFVAEWKIERDQVRNRLEELWETIFALRQPIAKLEACVTGPNRGPERAPKSGWKPFSVHERWGGFDQTTWFRLTFSIPAEMKGERVVALIRPGGESLAYVNGSPVQGLDNNRDEILLTKKARGGEQFVIELESVPSVRFDEYHHFEYADLAIHRPAVWDFYWDAKVVFEVVKQLDSNYAPTQQLFEQLKAALWAVDFQHKGEAAYFESIPRAQRAFRKALKTFETSYGLGALTVMGQSHIDTAWLWPLRETRRKCGRTFSTMLALLDRYPDFIFMCSQPVQYEWMKTHFPEQFARIKKYVREGRWEPFGGLWVENDCNVPCGEAIIRQIMYGNRFFEREFGMRSRSAWLPDAFGYTWSLPQILKKSGIDTFLTTKITWSRFTEFPYSMFQWEGADGTRVLGLMPPLNYNGGMRPEDCLEQWKLFKQKGKVNEVPFCFGYGDGGGGPTMEMIETARRLGNIVGMPQCKFGRMQDSVDRMHAQVPFEELPVFNGELYLEYHRGCQTTQASTKRHNRQCELLLRNAEWLSTLSLLENGPYDQETLYNAWRIVLTNQFHDILPGSSIRGVYEDTERDYAQARTLIATARDKALAHVVNRISTEGPGIPVIVFNPLSWVRTDVVRVDDIKLPKGAFHVAAPDGEIVPHQKTAANQVMFEARGVPPLGHAVYRIMDGPAPETPVAGALKVSEKGLENDFLRVRIAKNGTVTSVYDKFIGREALANGAAANDLQLFDDRPHGNEAWDIDHNFEDSMWRPQAPVSIEVVEEGPVRAIVRIVRKTEKSVITQDLTLYAFSPRIDFVTQVDWHETRVLMKASFPVDVRATHATNEIAFGAIERATHQNTAWDRARYELPGHRWADLSEGDYGVSLLNDCKYGYDVKGNVLRLSLLRSPIDPDPQADQGQHLFTYALYPHAGDWRNGTVQQAHELNNPLMAVIATPAHGVIEPVAAFASVDVDHVLIDTVKRHEDTDAVIVRVYEAYGQRGPVKLTFGHPPASITECDLMEENDTPAKLRESTVAFDITPYEIRTFKVTF